MVQYPFLSGCKRYEVGAGLRPVPMKHPGMMFQVMYGGG